MAWLDDELRRRWRLGIRPGLERITEVLARLESPPGGTCVVLVAGTNGKGSTSTFLDAILRAHGCHTGLYTSPHLVEAAERIRIDGTMVTDRAVASAAQAVIRAEASAGVTLTGFEWITALAMEIFRASGVQCQILEVGLGGRLDATNAAAPILSVITPIDLDHTALLGPDLTSIAREKAGILRAGRAALFAAQAPEAEAALTVAAREVGAGPVLRAGVDWRWSLDDEGLRWWGSEGNELGPVRPGLTGAHQGGNAALALAAAGQLLPALTGRAMDPAAALRGVEAAHLAGRLQRVRVQGRDVLLDVAHNPHGAVALAREYRSRWGRCPAALVGLKDDKDSIGVLEPLSGFAERLVFCPLPDAPHHPPEALARACPGPASAEAVDSWREGLARILEADQGPGPPLICGSHFLVGAVLAVRR